MKCLSQSIAAMLLILATAAISVWRLQPPASDNPHDDFDTQRALNHLEIIAREPHPMGSPANHRVRRYLIDQFKQLGLEVRAPEDQTIRVQRGSRSFDYTPQNVVARLRGNGALKGPGDALLLAAHYDSVEEGPGAGDDGAAVAALLEVARLLAGGPPLKRDIIFLLTDGEEAHLLGARAFVAHDEWKDDCGVVLNFEARGASGPSVMFETSRGNAWLIDQFASAAGHPITTSLAGDVYERMPNDTDFTVFRRAGMQGLNFAFIGSDQHYHQPTDDLAHLDPRSLRHHGQQAIALGRRLASMETWPQSGETSTAVYFDVLGAFVVRYPMSLVMPMAVVAGVLWVMATIGTCRTRWPRLRDLFGAVLAPVATTLLTLGTCLLLALAFPHARRDGQTLPVIYAMIAIAILLPILAFTILSIWLHPIWLTLGGLGVWVGLGVATALAAPGGSYLLILPALLYLLGMAARAILHRGASFQRASLLVASAIAMILIVPTVVLGAQALTTRGAPFLMVLPACVGWMVGAALVRRANLNGSSMATKAPAEETESAQIATQSAL